MAKSKTRLKNLGKSILLLYQRSIKFFSALIVFIYCPVFVLQRIIYTLSYRENDIFDDVMITLAIGYLVKRKFRRQVLDIFIKAYHQHNQWRIQGPPPPLLSGCILKQERISHQNALFLHKNFKNFLGRGHSPLPRPTSDPSAPYYKFLDPPLSGGLALLIMLMCAKNCKSKFKFVKGISKNVDSFF